MGCDRMGGVLQTLLGWRVYRFFFAIPWEVEEFTRFDRHVMTSNLTNLMNNFMASCNLQNRDLICFEVGIPRDPRTLLRTFCLLIPPSCVVEFLLPRLSIISVWGTSIRCATRGSRFQELQSEETQISSRSIFV